MNKKGMDISLNFVILAVLALIALIVIALFFTGGLTSLFKQTGEVGSISAEKISLYKGQCELYCTLGDENAWANPQFAEERFAGKTCEALSDELGLTKTLKNNDEDPELECVSS